MPSSIAALAFALIALATVIVSATRTARSAREAQRHRDQVERIARRVTEINQAPTPGRCAAPLLPPRVGIGCLYLHGHSGAHADRSGTTWLDPAS
ncbi:hypothetical protein [Kitasatospora sp. NPDC004289]